MTSHPIHEVLLVDPDDDVRECLALVLRFHGCRVVATRAPADTLQKLRSGFRPCIVLADPRRTGDEVWGLVDYLRADSVLKYVPLILIAREPMHLRCAHWRGVRECVAHPASPPSLVAAIERQCRRRRRLAVKIVPRTAHISTKEAS